MRIVGVAAVFVAACLAAPTSAQQRSLIVGDWISYQEIPESCPADHMCLNVHGVVDLDFVETLIGPRLPQRVKVKFWFHSRPSPTSRYILSIEPSSDPGVWIARRAGIVRDGDAPCVERERLQALEIPVPRMEQGRSRICFRNPSARRT